MALQEHNEIETYAELNKLNTIENVMHFSHTDIHRKQWKIIQHTYPYILNDYSLQVCLVFRVDSKAIISQYYNINNVTV